MQIINSYLPGQTFSLALVRSFTKVDQHRYSTNLTRLYADNKKRAWLCEVGSIVRGAYVVPDFSTDPEFKKYDAGDKHNFSNDQMYSSWSHFWLIRHADLDFYVNLMDPRVCLPWAPGTITKRTVYGN